MALTDCSVPSVDSFPTSVMTSIDGAVTMYPSLNPFRDGKAHHLVPQHIEAQIDEPPFGGLENLPRNTTAEAMIVSAKNEEGHQFIGQADISPSQLWSAVAPRNALIIPGTTTPATVLKKLSRP